MINWFRILKHEAKETGNIKRESKNYSYKEQMAVRELEKELAAKQNKTDTPQLTKKQQEMLQQQLDQEQTIRDNVKKVWFHFESHFSDGNILISRSMKMQKMYLNF